MNCVVFLLGGVFIAVRSPRNSIAVFTVTRLRLGAVRNHADSLAVHQAGDRGLRLSQRGAIVGLEVAAGRHCDRLGLDLQQAGTDVQADAVVAVVVREVRGCDVQAIGVCADILLGHDIVSKPTGTCIIFDIVQMFNNIQNPCLIRGLIARMADHDVIINGLAGIGESGLLFGAVVDVAGPAVGLDADSDVDLGDLQRAADVADAVIIRVGRAADDRVPGRYDSGAGIEAAVTGRVIRVGIGIADGSQAVSALQARHDDLVIQVGGQGQGRAVVLLAQADSGDSSFLLIKDREDAPVFGIRLSDFVRGNRLGSTKRSAFYGAVKPPARYRRTAEGKGLVNLQIFSMNIRKRFTVHVHIVDLNLCFAIIGIIEGYNVVVSRGAEYNRLLRCIRVKIQVLQLRMLLIQGIVINCSRQHGGRHGITVDTSNRHVRCDMNVLTIIELCRVQNKVGNVAGGVGFSSIIEGQFIAGLSQHQVQAAIFGSITRYSDGLFSDSLAHFKLRSSDNFLSCQIFIVLFIHIVNSIA